MRMDEAMKWFETSLKDYVEPIRGKFKKKSDLKEDSMIMVKKLIPEESFPVFL